MFREICRILRGGATFINRHALILFTGVERSLFTFLRCKSRSAGAFRRNRVVCACEPLTQSPLHAGSRGKRERKQDLCKFLLARQVRVTFPCRITSSSCEDIVVTMTILVGVLVRVTEIPLRCAMKKYSSRDSNSHS